MSEIDAVKRNFSINLSSLEPENQKLKDYLNSKGYEV